MTPRRYKVLVNLEEGLHWTWIFLPPAALLSDPSWTSAVCAYAISAVCFVVEIWLEEIIEKNGN